MSPLKKPVSRRANCPLPANFGTDRRKRLCITLIPGNGSDVPDLIEIRPERTRRAESIAVLDVYQYAMRCRVNCETLEKARKRKAAKAIIRERSRIDRMEQKLRTPMP